MWLQQTLSPFLLIRLCYHPRMDSFYLVIVSLEFLLRGSLRQISTTRSSLFAPPQQIYFACLYVLLVDFHRELEPCRCLHVNFDFLSWTACWKIHYKTSRLLASQTCSYMQLRLVHSLPCLLRINFLYLQNFDSW